MTDLPTENLAAVAALSSLRDAYPRLADVIEAEAYGTKRARQPMVRLSTTVLEANGELVRDERDGRALSARNGIRLSAPIAAPVRARLLDAQNNAHTVAIDQCWIASSVLQYRHAMLAWGPPRLSNEAGYRADPWEMAMGYLAVAVRLVPPAYAEASSWALRKADALIRSAAGLNDVRIPLPGHPDCPVCFRTGLKIDITSPDQRDWTIACRADCLCIGTQCVCGRPGRSPGQRHLWQADQFATRFAAGLDLRTLRRLAASQVRARKAAA